MASPAPPSGPSRLSSLDRTLIAVGFVLTTLVTSVVGFVAQDRAAECQAIRGQRLSDVDRFRGIASEFEPLVSTYMGAALHGKDVTASKRAVVLNLRQQRARLDYVTPYLDAKGKESAKRFNEAMVNFVVHSDQNPTGVNVGPLYQELNYIFANSQDLIEASNRATGVDSMQVSTGRFWKRTLNCSET